MEREWVGREGRERNRGEMREREGGGEREGGVEREWVGREGREKGGRDEGGGQIGEMGGGGDRGEREGGEGRKREVNVVVNWCFTPSQPVWLYQGNEKGGKRGERETEGRGWGEGGERRVGEWRQTDRQTDRDRNKETETERGRETERDVQA